MILECVCGDPTPHLPAPGYQVYLENLNCSEATYYI